MNDTLRSFARCLHCGTYWKQRLEERGSDGAVTVVGYFVCECRLCGKHGFERIVERVGG